MRMILATGNEDKIQEIQDVLRQFAIIPYSDLVESFEIVEDADSFEGNARLKALAVYQQVKSHMGEDDFVLADDSGISVEVLDNAPGIYSARYAYMGTPKQGNAPDSLNRKKLIEALGERGLTHAKAFYTSAICVVDSKGCEEVFMGFSRGEVFDKELGSNGFGYDSLFIPEGHEQTWAQMSSAQKNETSHRQKALTKLIAWMGNKIC